MKIVATINGNEYAVNLDQPMDISIPVSFDEEQLSAFAGPPAQLTTYKSGEFIGDVGQGGSCNCKTYSFAPHLNGTHTESVGHIITNPISVHEVLNDSFIATTVITVTPENGLIGKFSLEQNHSGFLDALIIRTLPNGTDKKTRNYSDQEPPFFSAGAMEYIVELGVKHLLVDMPSVDKMNDGGKLANHRIFWNVEAYETEIQKPSHKTITELVYVPDNIEDGHYMLNLQVAAFEGDATPSRPVLYEVIKQ